MKLMLDPGHGGHDPGAVGKGLQEKDLTLTIARHIRDILNQEYQGVAVKMTRDADVFVELSDRARMANDWGADYFMSIHINAGGGTGFETYSHTSQSSRSVAAQNVIHAEILKGIGPVTDRGKQNANFVVLRETNMPAILTEALFIDNTNDVARLKDPAFLEKVARGHVTGLEKAFGLNRIPTQQDELEQAIIVLQEHGIISTPAYWANNAIKGRSVKGEYAAELIQNVAKKLK